MMSLKTIVWLALGTVWVGGLAGCGGPTLSVKNLPLTDSDYEIWVKFEKDMTDGERTYCPKSTRARNQSKNGDANHCKGGSDRLQADAWCVAIGDTIFFRAVGNDGGEEFQIEKKTDWAFPFGNSCTPVQEGRHRGVQCTVTDVVYGDTFYYNIRNRTCELDPRIIVNRGATWN